MGSAKWIAGFLGWAAFGPIGGLLGFLFGAYVDRNFDAVKSIFGTGEEADGTWQRTTGSRGYTPGEQRNSFMVSLLVLSSAVIKADGKVMQQELNHVREFIRQNFGDNAVDEAMRVLEGLNRQNVDLYSVGGQIADNMNYSQRLQLFHYLAQIAMADGDFSKSEKDVLDTISVAIRLIRSDAQSVISMYYREADSAYKILEISPDATDEEVKSAYRRMAMKNHPDKVATLGPEVQKAAAEKFRKIQEAYETIKKERGMN
ncbi:MAG: TerB family tellurite resistance protein [Bacteroidales bacterium]|nr:TerB family tellurite resistance protein [Bacteroidales bacterium]